MVAVAPLLSGSSFADTLVRRLTGLSPLTEEDGAAVRELKTIERALAGAELVREGEPPRRARLVIQGWAARQRVLADGRRQILGFLLPGDAIGLTPRPTPLSTTNTVAITGMELLDATPLREAAASGRAPGLNAAAIAAAAKEEAQLIEHVVRLGRLSAYQRMAHLFLDLHSRLRGAGLVSGWRFPLPLTQEVLADSLGLSIVHVNRTLQQLRHEQLIELKGGWVKLNDPEVLASVADFRLSEEAGSR